MTGAVSLLDTKMLIKLVLDISERSRYPRLTSVILALIAASQSSVNAASITSDNCFLSATAWKSEAARQGPTVGRPYISTAGLLVWFLGRNWVSKIAQLKVIIVRESQN